VGWCGTSTAGGGGSARQIGAKFPVLLPNSDQLYPTGFRCRLLCVHTASLDGMQAAAPWGAVCLCLLGRSWGRGLSGSPVGCAVGLSICMLAGLTAQVRAPGGDKAEVVSGVASFLSHLGSVGEQPSLRQPRVRVAVRPRIRAPCTLD
jgi:hypothetical protein